MDRRITIKDVAKEAGVSFKTISNVINDTGSMRPETRRRVQAVIDRMGYHANNSARSLRTGTTGLIGLAVSPLDQPFAAHLANKVIDTAREFECGVVVSTYPLSGAFKEVVNGMSRLAVDGWIAFATSPIDEDDEVFSRPEPLVLVSDFLAHGRVDSVTMPNASSVRAVTRDLLHSGVRRIGLVGVPDWLDGQLATTGHRAWQAQLQRVAAAVEGTRELRTRGFVEAFQEQGLDPDWRLLVSAGDWTTPAGVIALGRMLEARHLPEVIICLNDALAIGVIHGLQQQGIRVPEQVQVIGFDNITEAQYANPALTTIDPDIDDYVRKAVSMLVERIQGFRGEARSYMTDFTVVERGSTRR